MFNRLREKWNVTPKQFWIIFIAFGCTGISSALIFRFVSGWIGLSNETFWLYRWSIKLVFMVVGYQILLLFYGGLFGQWDFFWAYEQKFLRRLGLIKIAVPSKNLLDRLDEPVQNVQTQFQSKKETSDPGLKQNRSIKQIAIFASGAGSNAKKIIEHFAGHTFIKVALIVCNKETAGVIAIAAENKIETLIIEREEFFRGGSYVDFLKIRGVDFIVLAGFLWKIPKALIKAYPLGIINIHPALLPDFGGKGMYGNKVHEAVIAAGKKESGITIHYVDEHYDEGDIIFQATCAIDENDNAHTLAIKVHSLEYLNYPKVIEKLLVGVKA